MISKNLKYPIVIIAVFIWIGFVCSISFMEAWLKFRAMHVTLPIGLSIGRLIFDALNKVEWFLAFVIMMNIRFNRNKPINLSIIFLATPVILLVIQTIFVLPALNERVEVILSGNKVLPSFLHFYYLAMELIKIGCLFVFGFKAFKCYKITIKQENAIK